MRELEVKITGQQAHGESSIHIDGQPVTFKNNEFGSSVCKYQTEKDKLNIKIFRVLDVGGIVWFITQLLFFIISIFGIFDVHRKERCIIVDFEIDVDLKEENKITLQFGSPQEQGKAIEVQTDLAYEEVTNNFFVDVKAKKTLKILRVAKIILTLAILGVTTGVLFSLL